MATQQIMGVTKASFCIILFLLLIPAGSLTENEETQDGFLSQLLDPTSGLLDDDLAEQLWSTCLIDLIHLKEEIEDLDLCFPQNSQIRSIVCGNIQKLINTHHPQLKQILLHCLRRNGLPFRVSGEDDDSKIWPASFIKSLFSRPSGPRRNLGDELSPQLSIAPSPGPSAISPTSSLAPSPAPAPSIPQVPESSPPASSPKKAFFPQLQAPVAGGVSTNPPTDANLQADKKSNHDRTVVLAVVITAVVTFVVAAVLFLCCSKFCRTRRAKQNDERPLLSLSLSDYSVGSTHFNYFGNSMKEEKLGFQSSSNYSSDNKKTSSLNANSHVTTDNFHTRVQESQSIGSFSAAASSSIELKPPPGRAGIATSGLPPLKPPPGRLNPLPPEPPSFRPNNAAAAAAAPPPPAPPQPVKPHAGAVGAPPRPPPALSQPVKHPSDASGALPPGPPPPPPPPAPGAKPGGRPPPPPPPKSGIAPPRPPPPLGPKMVRPLASGPKDPQHVGASSEGETDAPKAKLKPFFWDKVQANSDQSMVWNQIKSGSFQFNEEMIETLFGYGAVDKNKVEQKKESSSQDLPTQYVLIIDRKKAQNLLILLRALNVTTEEVCDALHEGNELPSEFLQTVLKMAPTPDEEIKLRLFSGEKSQLGPADRFLKSLVDIPFAFKRMEALLFMGTLREELTTTKESFAVLEVACKELRNSRLFLKLLEAVLKTGNRMNDGTFRGGAQAFKLDTLLKLSDVKGTDGKTTLLHFVVQEIIRSEGKRAARLAKENWSSSSSVKTDDLSEEISDDNREEHYHELGLQVVSHLSSELENVKKASTIDADSLTGTTAKLGHGLLKTRDFLNTDMKSITEDRGFYQTVTSFVQDVETDVTSLLEEEKKIMALVNSTGDYFHGKAGKDEGIRLFVIVRDFLIMVDKVCREVKDAQRKSSKTQKHEASKALSSSPDVRPPSSDFRQLLFPAITDRRIKDYNSSDDESP